MLELVVKHVAASFRHFLQNIHTEYNVGKKKKNLKEILKMYVMLIFHCNLLVIHFQKTALWT